MEIRVLRYFLTVAREGSITNAANYLHVTQPTISRQLKDLEDELDAQLFIRHKQTISLTNEGMLLRKRAEEILSIVNKTEEDFKSMGDILAGEVYLGGGESPAISLIADVIAELREDYPLINYHLYSGNAEDVSERLDKGMLDFGIMMDPVNLSKYNHLRLPAVDTWGVLMQKDSPLAKKESIRKDDLIGLPIIASRQSLDNSTGESSYLNWFGEEYDKLNFVTSFNLVYNAAILVEKGIGYAITFDKIANTSADHNLTFRPLEPRLESGLHIVWKKYQIFSPAAEIFHSRLNQTFKIMENN